VIVTLPEPPAAARLPEGATATSHFDGDGFDGVLVSLDVHAAATIETDTAITPSARRQRLILSSTFLIVSGSDTPYLVDSTHLALKARQRD